ncbi:MAG TPA: hypothetical protein PLK90_01780 [Clostridiales bacterium]|nr:hypothetical protein [Clostridiales bacterium]HQP69105.1 hypothetical protein [Clostridiales bacterium]
MRRIVTYLIILGIMQLCARSFDYRNNSEKPTLDQAAEKDTRSYIPYEENRVHRAGSFWLNVSNCGVLGNNGFGPENETFLDPCTGKKAASGDFPGGSDFEYLSLSSIWCGGYLDSAHIDINSNNSSIFQGPLVSTGSDGCLVWGWSNELWPVLMIEDPSGLTLGRISETSNIEGRMNCLFEEVYDPKTTAYEQFSTMFTDKHQSPDNWDPFGRQYHVPLGIEIKQTSYAWPYDYAKKFIIIDYTIYNRNSDKKDIYDFFIGVINDSNIGKRDTYCYRDDICGFIPKWNGYIDPATGESKTVDLNLVWTADNDGRSYISGDEWGLTIGSEQASGNPLDEATGVLSIRVLRNPNPNLRYSFNIYSMDFYNESLDWGPRWKSGMHTDWKFDLTLKQRGYDDTNYDSLETGEPYFQKMFGGRTEGTPLGDNGRYMVMSNDEFDYDLTTIREVYLGMSTQSDGTPIPQADKWQSWIVTGTEQQYEVPDGRIEELNNVANGSPQEFLLSFGPLGNESYVNVAVDTDHDSLGMPDDFINKKVWKFAYGDSLKLTLAFMVSENFHTSLEQDPNYRDSTIVDLSDGLDVSLFDQGWYDAYNNVIWAERVFDTPMFDTPFNRWGTTRKDGWYGEDVGADATFGDLVSDTYCWWLDKAYPGPDEGEGDFEMTTFTAPVTDCYGNTASNEDKLLRYGRQHADGDYGITGDLDDGEGFGYMVKYDKLDGSVPQGTWVRYGYDNGRLDAGDGVPDFTSPPPPPSPKIKVSERDNDIIVEWISHEFYTGDDGSIGVAGPEFTYDPYTRLYDFEGYNIELSPDRQLGNFTTIFSVDKINYSYQNVADVHDYLDNPIPADTLSAHPEDYPAMRTVNGKIYQLVQYGDNTDLTQDYIKPDIYSYTCKLDSSQFDQWGEIRYYKFILHNQTLAEMKYIAVTAKDFGAPKMGVPAIKSSPESNATATVTATLTTTDDVIVVPNPYRGDVKYTEIGWEDLDGDYTYAEEYRKIAFLNIPERCVIRIYTLAGDLCKVIAHNGNSDSDAHYWYGRNGACWNLINDNRQAVLSGIYLFSVQDVDKKKDDFVGKFVIIK